jgi:hypothetical protein
MRNISTAVRGHYDNDRYMWAIIIRRFCDNRRIRDLYTRGAGVAVGRCRAVTGPPPFRRAEPCPPAGSPDGPGTAWYTVPCQPGPGGLWAGPCSCRAKWPCRVMGRRASCFMENYSHPYLTTCHPALSHGSAAHSVISSSPGVVLALASRQDKVPFKYPIMQFAINNQV